MAAGPSTLMRRIQRRSAWMSSLRRHRFPLPRRTHRKFSPPCAFRPLESSSDSRAVALSFATRRQPWTAVIGFSSPTGQWLTSFRRATRELRRSHTRCSPSSAMMSDSSVSWRHSTARFVPANFHRSLESHRHEHSACQRFCHEVVRPPEVCVMADDHSRARVPGASLWPYPPYSVVCFRPAVLLGCPPALPENLYVFDSSISWTLVLTHEDDGKRRICAAVGIKA